MQFVLPIRFSNGLYRSGESISTLQWKLSELATKGGYYQIVHLTFPVHLTPRQQNMWCSQLPLFRPPHHPSSDQT
jgi:hypothetical protein